MSKYKRKPLLFPKTGFAPLDSFLRGVDAFIQQAQFGQMSGWQCAKCGAIYQTNLGFTPRFCMAGCGETMKPLKAARAGAFRNPLPSQAESDRVRAAQFIADNAVDGHSWQDVLKHVRVRRAAYRSAAAKLHPDKGGSKEDFLKLQNAMEVLEG